MKPLTKGKCSIKVNDDPPSLSELENGDLSHNDLEKSNPSSEDGGDDDDDDDLYVVKITNREARQMFDDEVLY